VTAAPLPMRSCHAARKRDGAPCRSRVVLEDGFCPAHSPTRGLEMAELGRAGGLASVEARRELGKTVRERLRDRVEAEADKIWRVYRDAFDAEGGDGDPDHRARLASVEGVLAQAYGRRPQAIVGDDGQPLKFVLESAFARGSDERAD
jgi:hypothetical protein